MTSVNPGDVGTATSTAAAATVNHTEGQITTEALVTAAGASYSFTLTNACIYPGSLVQAWVVGGTNTTKGVLLTSAVVSAGQAVLALTNLSASALNGTLIFNFVVL